MSPGNSGSDPGVSLLADDLAIAPETGVPAGLTTSRSTAMPGTVRAKSVVPPAGTVTFVCRSHDVGALAADPE